MSFRSKIIHCTRTPLMLEWNTYLSNSETQLTWELKGVTFCHKNEAIKHLFLLAFCPCGLGQQLLVNCYSLWKETYLFSFTVIHWLRSWATPMKYFTGIACSSIITIDASCDNVVLELIIIRMLNCFLKILFRLCAFIQRSKVNS
jgi:hypothetical protein